MASQNQDPAAAASSSAAALKANESGNSATRGSVSKRWEPDLCQFNVHGLKIVWSDIVNIVCVCVCV